MIMTLLEGRREPTNEEIEGAKILRSFPQTGRPILGEFLSNVYFEIQDDGITNEIADKICSYLRRFAGDKMEIIELADKIRENADSISDGRVQRHTDLHLAILRYVQKQEDNKNTKLGVDSIDLVVDIVCAFYGVKKEIVLSDSRVDKYVQARMMVVKLCHNRATLKTIGKALGNRDHSSVLNMLKRYNKKAARNAGVKMDFDKLYAEVYSA